MKWRNTLLPFLAVIAAVTATRIVIYTSGSCNICSKFDGLLRALEDMLGNVGYIEQRACDGTRQCCVYHLIRCIEKLSFYVGNPCDDCDHLAETLTKLKLLLQIHWDDGSGYDPLPWLRDQDCTNCLIHDIIVILKGLIFQDVDIDLGDLDCGSHRCAVAKLLALLKIFVKDLLIVMQNPPEEVDCDDDNSWSCILRRLKYVTSQKHHRRDCQCQQYSCKQCRNDNGCDYCNTHYNCDNECEGD